MAKEYIPVEQLLDSCHGSVYTLTMLVAKRAMQLADGEEPLIDKPSEKLLDNALREIAAKKVCLKSKKK